WRTPLAGAPACRGGRAVPPPAPVRRRARGAPPDRGRPRALAPVPARRLAPAFPRAQRRPGCVALPGALTGEGGLEVFPIPLVGPRFSGRIVRRERRLGMLGRTERRFGFRFRVLPGERRSEEHTSELQSRFDLVCRLLLEKKNVI